MKDFNFYYNKIRKLIGQSINDIFYQASMEMIIINFGSKNEYYSLHCDSFYRFYDNDDVYLTSNDIFYNIRYNLI